jgi:hypothetical protein
MFSDAAVGEFNFKTKPQRDELKTTHSKPYVQNF